MLNSNLNSKEIFLDGHTLIFNINLPSVACQPPSISDKNGIHMKSSTCVVNSAETSSTACLNPWAAFTIAWLSSSGKESAPCDNELLVQCKDYVTNLDMNRDSSYGIF